MKTRTADIRNLCLFIIYLHKLIINSEPNLKNEQQIFFIFKLNHFHNVIDKIYFFIENITVYE